MTKDSLTIMLALWVWISWGGNVYKLTECDFKEDYRCEIIHGAGLFPIASLATVWFESD